MTEQGKMIECANCCSNSDDLHNNVTVIDFGIPSPDPTKNDHFYCSPHNDNKLEATAGIHSVQTVLSSVYKLDYLEDSSHQGEYCQEIGLCLRCAQLATQLYKYYLEFGQVRQFGSYLDTHITKLNEFIQSLINNASKLTVADSSSINLNNLSGPWVKLNRLSPQQVLAAVSSSSERNDDRLDDSPFEEIDKNDDEYEPNDDEDEDSDVDHLMDIVMDTVDGLDNMTRSSPSERIRNSSRKRNISVKRENKRRNYLQKSKIEKSSLNNNKKVRGRRKKKEQTATKVNLSCPLCTEKIVKIKDMKKHLLTHLDDDCTTCPICFEEYPDSLELRRHVQGHGTLTRECSICAKKFSTESKLTRHLKTHEESSSGYVEDDEDEKKELPNVDCRHCPEKFSSLQELRQHYTTQHPGLYPFQCSSSDCDRVFFFEKQKLNHEATHNTDKRCVNCSKQFVNEDELGQHMETCQGTRCHACPVCQKMCSKKYLKEHMKIHDGPRVECTICHKTFSSANSLRTHAQVHTGEKNYTCHICLMSFAQSGHLKGHIRGVHLGQKSHLCQLCGMAFARAYGLKRHTLRHGEERAYKCTFENCDKFFKDIETRRNHEVIHGDKNNICQYCGKSFYAVSNLARHLRLHTGDRPYKCSFYSCDGCFIDARQLKKHILAHHSNNPEQGIECDVE